jgi:capsular polysaccharide biosynthesis protein
VQDELVVEPFGSRPVRKKRYSDTFFRHKILVLAPLIICMIAGIGMATRAHKSFASSVSLWADSPAPGNSSIVTGTANGAPSASAQAVLSELLGTGTFRADVAKQKALAGMSANISPKSVTVSAPGPQLLSVTAKAATPQLAVATATAVSNQFITTVNQLLGARQQQVVANALLQLRAAQTTLNGLPAGTARDVASNAVTTAQQTYNNAVAAQQTAAKAELVSVYSPASGAVKLASKKTLIFAAGGGIIGGLLLTIAVLCLLVSADRSVRRESDVEDILSLPVIGSIDSHPRRAKIERWDASA